MQPIFNYQEGQLYCEDVCLARIAAAVATPVYIYSQKSLLQRAETFKSAVPPGTLICYAVKANGNPALIRLLAQSGFGADVTSGGELFLAQKAGVPPEKMIYSGVGKTRPEIESALKSNIHALHVESEMELEVIADIASARQQIARIGVRVNPHIDAQTHPHISTGLHEHKFGVSRDRVLTMLQVAEQHEWLRPVSVAAHIGSQITKLPPFAESAKFLVDLANELAGTGIQLAYIDVGGGLGINYDGDWEPVTEAAAAPFSNRQSPISIANWVTAVSQPVRQAGYDLVLEPGRSLIGPAGLLLTQVIYTKQQGEKSFVITDAGMNDLIRPTLYQANHPIWPVQQPASNSERLVDIVGPICETGDYLARNRPFPPIKSGDLLAVMQAGAYGFAMSSNYNGRLRPAEVLVSGDQFQIIRHRQHFEHLLDGCPEETNAV